jgi:hypothetical protein
VCADVETCIKYYAANIEGDIAAPVLQLIAGFDALRNQGYTTRLLDVLGSARKLEESLGFPLSYLSTWEEYDMKYTNPVYLPDQAGVDEMYLKDYISFGTWTCLTRAQGNMPNWWTNTLNAKQELPDIGQVIRLWHHGLVPDDQLRKRLRGLGVLDDKRADEFKDLERWYPSLIDTMKLWQLGVLPDDKALSAQLKMVGVMDDAEREWLKQLTSQLFDKREVYDLFRRGQIKTMDELKKRMLQVGVIDTSMIDEIKVLMNAT